MNFNQRDIAILMSMTIAIIFLTFTFSSLGFTDKEIKENDIPELDLKTSEYALNEDFPSYPGDPDSGELKYYYNDSNDENYRNIEVKNDGDTRIAVELVDPVDTPTDEIEFQLNKYNETNTYINKINLSGEGDSDTISEYGFDIRAEIESVEDMPEIGEYIVVKYKMTKQPENSGFIYQATDGIVEAIVYIGKIFSWFSQTVLSISLTVIITVYKVVAFMIGLITFLVDSYYQIIDSATGFAKIVLLIPGLLLSIELGKIGMVIVSLLPTT